MSLRLVAACFFAFLAVALRADPPSAPATPAAPADADVSTEPVEPPPAATDPTARKILENFITVTGGPAALQQVGLIQASGTEYPLTKDGVPIHFTCWIAPPDRIRLDTVIQEKYGQTQETHTTLTGNTGWTIETTAKHPEVDDTSAAKEPALARLAGFVYPFINYDACGLRYQYAGQEKFRGLSALVVKSWAVKGPPEYLYFDPQKFLLLRIRRDIKIGDVHTWANIYFTKFAKVSGLWFPMAWEQALSDAVTSRTEVAQVQVAPRADPALFVAPVIKEIILRQAVAPGAASTSAPVPPGPVSP